MNSKKTVILASTFVGIGILAIAFVLSSKSSTPTPSVSFTMEQIKAANGKDSNPCYVALEGVAYEIKQGNKWRNGEHTTSEGQAYCGMDATDIIKKSPHGKSVLSLLTKVGTVQP